MGLCSYATRIRITRSKTITHCVRSDAQTTRARFKGVMKHKTYMEVTVSKIADSTFPVWLECSFKDSDGIEHLIIEKAPVLTSVKIPENELPSTLKLECNLIDTQENQITIELLHGIESTKGISRFTLNRNTYHAS